MHFLVSASHEPSLGRAHSPCCGAAVTDKWPQARALATTGVAFTYVNIAFKLKRLPQIPDFSITAYDLLS
jgi:hypothetical protein